MMADHWFTFDGASRIDTPALVVYYDRVKKNIKTAIKMIGDISRLRPHVKTNKSPNVTRLLLKAGIQKFKCATIAEAEMLAQCGAPNVLLAYQPVGPKQARLLKLIETYQDTTFACLVDQYDIARDLSKLAQSNHTTIRVYIDIDVGMGRTGVAPGAAAVELYEQANQLSGLKVEGLHIYDGHIHDTDLEERRRACNAAFRPIETMADTLTEKGMNPKIVAGGSPTFPIHASRLGVECSPGTFVFWDKGYQQVCPEQDFLPAALVLTRVISLPEDGIACLDLGYKSIASENALDQRVYFYNAPALTFLSQHEEHLVVDAEKGHSLKPSNLLYGVPIHICPTVALYERAHVVKDNRAKGEWRITARDRKMGI
jgi:D-serine deaminase-like pyridoxal phosphate-dependent protein